MIIGERIKRERLNKGFTQEELGKLVGVSPSAICGYETGKKVPTLNILVRLANVFDTSTDYFLGRDVKVFFDVEETYSVMIAKEDFLILKELKQNSILYKNFFINPQRTIKRINAEIDW